eukprot:scaffold19808_cov23-Tisochrysis_lutea.AAC.1
MQGDAADAQRAEPSCISRTCLGGAARNHASQPGNWPLPVKQYFFPFVPPCIQAKEIMYHKANLNRIMADYTVSLLPCLYVSCANNWCRTQISV